MKRRNFIKGILGLAVAPVVAKASKLIPIEDNRIPVDVKDDSYIRKHYANKMLTPEEVTREALQVLEKTMKEYPLR